MNLSVYLIKIENHNSVLWYSHFFVLLSPLFIIGLPPPMVLFNYPPTYLSLDESPIRLLPISFIFVSKNPFESFVNPAVF